MKSKNTISSLKKGYCILFLVLPFFAMAQDSFNDNVNDVEPPAPIDNYVLLALLLGSYFGYRFFKTQYTIKTKN